MPPADDTLEQNAVSAALKGDWKTAIRLNSAILAADSQNLDALNRLGYAYLKLGKLTNAKTVLQKALVLDPYNQIALKNNKLTSVIRKKDLPADNDHTSLSPLQFIEDPGKTKIASCVNLAPNKTLSFLSPGQEIYLKAKNHVVELRSRDNTYLAALPDDISFKLIKLLSAGNSYQVIVKGINKNSLVVLIRELKRGKRFANQPSFISQGITSYTPLARTESAVEHHDTSAGSEEEEETVDEVNE